MVKVYTCLNLKNLVDNLIVLGENLSKYSSISFKFLKESTFKRTIFLLFLVSMEPYFNIVFKR